MAQSATGISFPLRIESGEIVVSDTELSVSDSIRAIIDTRPGERVMRPDFGSKCWDFVHENVNVVSMARLRDEARRALTTQEPRIRVLAVTVKKLADSEAGGSGLVVDVTYRLSGQVATESVEISGPST